MNLQQPLQSAQPLAARDDLGLQLADFLLDLLHLPQCHLDDLPVYA
jgi:hypothetical protein